MRRVGAHTTTTMFLLVLGAALPAGDAVARQTSLKEQLAGTWKLVSVDNVGSVGSKGDVSGPNPKDVVIDTSDGHFALVDTRSDVPRLAPGTRDTGSPADDKAVVQVSVASFGTYSGNEADKVITLHIEGGTIASLIGRTHRRTHQRRIIISLTADELKFTNPATSSGQTLHLTWKRAK